MNDVYDWTVEAENFAKRVKALPMESQSAEALIEIARQLMSLNAGIDLLTDATNRVADNS